MTCSSLKVTTVPQTWWVFNLYYNRRVSQWRCLNYGIQPWHDGRLIHDINNKQYILMLVAMTLTLMQGHNGSAKDKNQRWIISTTKQARSITLATTLGHFFFCTWPWPWKRFFMAWPSSFVLYPESLDVHWCRQNIPTPTRQPIHPHPAHTATPLEGRYNLIFYLQPTARGHIKASPSGHSQIW